MWGSVLFLTVGSSAPFMGSFELHGLKTCFHAQIKESVKKSMFQSFSILCYLIKYMDISTPKVLDIQPHKTYGHLNPKSLGHSTS
jgi:hypothetical protein